MNFTTLLADVDFLVDTDSNTYSVADKTRNINLALDEVSGIIIGCDGTWQWDDSNYTDLPIGTTTITSGQADYSFDDDYLTIQAIEVKGTDGKWTRLLPIDLYPEYNSQSKSSITDYLSTPGQPKYYDKVGESFFLYPPANYTQAASLKAFFQRKADHFETSDTTKKPGFADHLHRFLSFSCSYDWAIAKQHPKGNWLAAKKEEFKQLIKAFYSKRTKDEAKRMVPNPQNNK